MTKRKRVLLPVPELLAQLTEEFEFLNKYIRTQDNIIDVWRSDYNKLEAERNELAKQLEGYRDRVWGEDHKRRKIKLWPPGENIEGD